MDGCPTVKPMKEFFLRGEGVSLVTSLVRSGMKPHEKKEFGMFL